MHTLVHMNSVREMSKIKRAAIYALMNYCSQVELLRVSSISDENVDISWRSHNYLSGLYFECL